MEEPGQATSNSRTARGIVFLVVWVDPMKSNDLDGQEGKPTKAPADAVVAGPKCRTEIE